MVRCLLRLGNRFHGVIPPPTREVKTRAPVPLRRRLLSGSLPIARPGKIVCVGLNYRDHAEEQGTPLPERPILFAKWPNTLIGPGEPIVLPAISKKVDYEAELGVVIGSRVRGASAENALEAVAGYLCLNDVSARGL